MRNEITNYKYHNSRSGAQRNDGIYPLAPGTPGERARVRGITMNTLCSKVLASLRQSEGG